MAEKKFYFSCEYQQTRVISVNLTVEAMDVETARTKLEDLKVGLHDFDEDDYEIEEKEVTGGHWLWDTPDDLYYVGDSIAPAAFPPPSPPLSPMVDEVELLVRIQEGLPENHYKSAINDAVIKMGDGEGIVLVGVWSNDRIEDATEEIRTWARDMGLHIPPLYQTVN